MYINCMLVFIEQIYVRLGNARWKLKPSTKSATITSNDDDDEIHHLVVDKIDGDE